jgi:methyl-accepting chemotaxis protein/methyl-accepting chemotaxis protein-1 (serine sensor receptor)
VIELSNTADQIASASIQSASASESMAQSASKQAATIEETSAASVEINTMAQLNTQNARATTEMVTRSQGSFEQTNQSLKDMLLAMDGITESSQKISKISKVIDEIAFQTNILALNAAVEAARAGDAGMGFAVVADEVRNLAQRCTRAAQDTATLIEDSILRSHSGKAKLDRVAEDVQGITSESAKVKNLVDEISHGSVEQARGIDMISHSMVMMEQATQNSAAGAEQSAAAAAQLNSQAQTMRTVVKQLNTLIEGASRTVSYAALKPQQGWLAGETKVAAAKATAVPRAQSAPKFKTTIRIPVVRTAVPALARTQTSASDFPLDDDFKEF